MPGGLFGTLNNEEPLYKENPTFIPVVLSLGIVNLNGGGLDLQSHQAAALEKVVRDPDVIFQSRSSALTLQASSLGSSSASTLTELEDSRILIVQPTP